MILSTANVRKELEGANITKAVHEALPADVVCWQEVETLAHARAIDALPGMTTYWATGHPEARANNFCAISWRSDRYKLVDAGHDVIGEGIAHVQPNRVLVWVILEDLQTGERVAVISVHTVSGLAKTLQHFAQWAGRNRPEEAAHELAEIAATTRLLSKRADYVVGGGDLNHIHKLGASVLGATPHYAVGPTHGKNWFDVIWTNAPVTNIYRRTHTPSDHDVLVATIDVPPKENPVATETRVVDWAWGGPSSSTVKAHGYVGVMRYIALGTADKHLTSAEARAHRNAGLHIGVVAESTADRALAGHAAGVSDAHAALAAANALGVPKNVPIFAAVDFNATWGRVSAYLDGWRSVLGSRAGEYGPWDVIAGSPLDWHWQAGASTAWSGGRNSRLHPKAHLYQRRTMTHPIPGCDENVVCRPIPFWGGELTPPGVNPKPTPAPKPKVPTRVENFHSKYQQTGIADLRILDRAAVTRTGDVRDIRNRLAFQVRQLPHDKGSSRVNKVTATFVKSRTIDLNLLDAAVKAGRVGKVKQVRDRIKALIGQLPPW